MERALKELIGLSVRTQSAMEEPQQFQITTKRLLLPIQSSLRLQPTDLASSLLHSHLLWDSRDLPVLSRALQPRAAWLWKRRRDSGLWSRKASSPHPWTSIRAAWWTKQATISSRVRVIFSRWVPKSAGSNMLIDSIIKVFLRRIWVKLAASLISSRQLK